VDENVMDKGVADTVRIHKRQHDDDEDDDEDPSAGPNQGKAPTKNSKTDKYATTQEPIEELIAEVVMDDLYTTTNEDVENDVDRPQDYVAPKTNKPSRDTWFKQPPRPPTPKPEWNKHQVNNPEGDCCPFDLTKPLPLIGRPGRLTVASEYFFNNDLEFMKSSGPKKKYTTSITKTKAARYVIVGIKDMVPTLWSTTKVGYDKDAKNGIKHWGERLRRVDRHVYKFKEGDFVNLHLNNIEDMLLLAVQHKLFQLDGSKIVDLIVALCMFTRRLIIKRRVEDLQVGVE
ncbi:hypothetical protein Tco_1451955, partial [Tanacetum coccineum]